MNKFLRTAPTARLLGVLAGALIAVAAGTTIAIAATSSGPVPPPRPLAVAIHRALAAPALSGISANITFTNNLISSSEMQGSDPLLSGGSGRVWVTKGAFRLEVQGSNGDANAVVRDGSFWAYDPSSNTVYEGKLPARATGHSQRREAIPSVSQIQAGLRRMAAHLHLSGAIPSDVAGRPTYTLSVSPKQSAGLVGAAELAWDALRGVPLRFALYARGDSTPVLALQATGITYGKISSAVFAIQPPHGAHVVNVSLPGNAQRSSSKRHHRPVSGLRAVSTHLSFTLSAPTTLAGLSRQSVTLLGSDRVLILYGRGLGGVAVVEQVARPGTSALARRNSSGGDQPGLTLPTISINGTTGQELDTALGTVIRFTRAGVQYSVLGSVRPGIARAAARSL